MTNNPTIDGVSRATVETIVSIHPSDTRYRLAKEELRALLDAPVVERRPIYQVEGLLDGGGGWLDTDKEDYERCAKNQKMYRARIIYLEPSTGLDAWQQGREGMRAERDAQIDANNSLQSTIAQLKAENERLRGGVKLVEAEGTPQYLAEACDKFDWTPEEALRFYAEGKHFDIQEGRTRILCTGAIASYALKNIGGDYADMKGIKGDLVALLSRKEYVHQGLSHTDARTEGWNACLDAAAALNPLKTAEWHDVAGDDEGLAQ